MKLLLSLCLLCSVLSSAPKLNTEEAEGEKLYKLNCMACHVLDKSIVGPSLIEIGHIYKRDPEALIKWSMNPGQKRKGAIRMPPMSHIGKANLVKVAAYIFKVTKGKKFVAKKDKGDPYAHVPSARIQRMFMPNAGPAAIAISIYKDLHLCWDAGTCQFRYAWTADFIDQWGVLKGNGNGLVNIKGPIFAKTDQGKPFDLPGELKFKGYKIIKGLPLFLYSIGDTDFEVSFDTSSSQEIKINFRTTATQAITYRPLVTQGTWAANKGKLTKDSLTLSPAEAQNFTITFSAGATK